MSEKKSNLAAGVMRKAAADGPALLRLGDASRKSVSPREAEAMSAAIAAMRVAMEKLVSLADSKLSAIRTADAQGLLRVAAEEGPALEALLVAEQKRREATAEIARTLGVVGTTSGVGEDTARRAVAHATEDTARRALAHQDQDTARRAVAPVNQKSTAHRAVARKTESSARGAVDISKLRVTEVATYLPQPMASQVGAAALRLKGLGEELKRKNALVRDVTHGLQAHIRGIFASLARDGEESISYGPNGRESRNRVRTWVDAVG